MPKASRKELRKSLFKKGSEARQEAKKESKAKHEAIEATRPEKPETQKRFILFVGNLPYEIKEEEIKQHFKNCRPSSIRLRTNGICFLEFSGDDAAAQLHHALQYHHSLLGKRKINVEFSAGGGGNSKHRRDKIQQKNKDFQEELKEKEKRQSSGPGKSGKGKPDSKQAPAALSEADTSKATSSGINPARFAALKNKR